ncbi:MAG: ATP-binding protein [Atribacterota bacterium]|nr:ATP-binding protein [Atribacterota bacterium]MDD4895949.1 ATP-binding protein [Atribacterota bacterium]MDD5636722.1 ATP-binding protein [Atribacterota bacterium]
MRLLKNILVYLIIIVLFSILCLISLSSFIKSQYINSKIKELTDLSSTIQTVIEPLFEQENWLELENLIKEIFNQSETRISIILTDGKVIAETFKDLSEMESHFNRPEVKVALQGEIAHRIRYSSTTKEDMLYVAIPVFIENNLKAIIRLSTFLEELNFILSRLRNMIVLVSVLMILLSMGIAYLVDHKTKRTMKELIQGFREVGEGHLETRILLPSREPEINELINQFNRMTVKLSQIIRGLSQQREELSSIIASVPSGIALVDEEGRIILSNSHFDKIFSSYSYDSKDKYFWEILRENKLNQKVSELIEKKRNFSTEFELNGNIYLGKGTYLDQKSKSVLVLYDITTSRKLEQLKKELVTNISHELRTPLTSIKGYLETLKGASARDREKYLSIIKRNLERIINMVNDLLFLSELEDKEGKVHLEKVDLGEIVVNMHKIFALSLKDKNLRFNINIPLDLPKIEADQFKIEQMFINLIDNAIKFTDKGGITISLELITEQRIKIEVADTGIGLKKEELSRVFERFYVANRARSRKEGGTGLGLSIVKHIVLLHQGDIEIDSQPGLGTKVKVILPINPILS